MKKEREGKVLYMSAYEQLKLDVVVKVVSGTFDFEKALAILDVSESTFWRYLRAYREKGHLFVKHGNYQKSPVNKTPQNLKHNVLDLVKNKYFDFNMLHCVIFANSAEAKGRIERHFNTMQDRLIPEMRSRGIRSYQAANSFLQDQFLPNEYTTKFTVTPANLQTAYKPLPQGINLDEIFCLKHYRMIKRDHTVPWQGKLYQIESPVKYPIYKQKVEIRTYQDLTFKMFFAGKELPVKLVNPLRMAA